MSASTQAAIGRMNFAFLEFVYGLPARGNDEPPKRIKRTTPRMSVPYQPLDAEPARRITRYAA